jgi:hypothetical protein
MTARNESNALKQIDDAVRFCCITVLRLIPMWSAAEVIETPNAVVSLSRLFRRIAAGMYSLEWQNRCVNLSYAATSRINSNR